MSINPIPVHSVRIDDSFWSQRQEIARKQGIPYQYEALHDRLPDAEPSCCIRNFRVAAGLESAPYHGFPFQDSDLAKWLEAVAFSLMWHPDPELEKTADEMIDLIGMAQQPDGYLSTFYILNGLEKRWTNLTDHHELYIAGHMIEAAVAYFQATGKSKFLNICLKLVDHIDSMFGPEEGKLKGYPGHPVIEMALMRLFEITEDEKHLNLAKYFIDQRGQAPNYFANEDKDHGRRNHWEGGPLKYMYYQAGKPVREQTEAEGHSVRATYLYSGMEDVARETEDKELSEACRTLWKNMITRRMYITGSIGSSEYGEAFTYDYDLPNDTTYSETCASIALMFFAQRLLRSEPRGEYADVMERALYNSVISGMDLDGRRFFYVNPLEVVPEACEKDYLRRHVKPERQKWFGCACCPPNLMRLLTSLGSYIYGVDDENNTVYTHLYIGSSAEARVAGQNVRLTMKTEYPWDGKVTITVNPAMTERFKIALRIPGWCKLYSVKVKGYPFANSENRKAQDGYIYIDRMWETGDVIELNLSMPVQLVRANPRVREDIGKVAITRGPIVYCAEEIDNGKNLHLYSIDPRGQFTVQNKPGLLEGVVTIDAPAHRRKEWSGDALYSFTDAGALSLESSQPATLTLIPYYAWSNRGPNEMTVWVGCAD